MYNYVIRNFKVSDIYEIISIVERLFNENYETSMYIDYYNSWSDGFLVAEVGGKVVGVLLAMISSPMEARVLVLGVDEGYRSMGIGSALMHRFTENCIKLGLKTITLEVRVGNIRARNFYTKIGFHVVGRISNYYRDGEDGFVLHKAIG
ncbi:MAG: ribosomal protein S18-alanine N-acetyltransferase [Candidatus Thermoplasmatota archaeon]